MSSKNHQEDAPQTENDNETEDETHHKKRSRRVSFAETTAVHFFNRDDDCDTPPDPPNLPRTASDEIRQLLESSSSSSSSDDETGGPDEDDVGSAKQPFLRPADSSASPGDCFGSATSNDEDNFFGPVSADFIRPGRLSDSAVSDENHDVTMDSTAFSMHFKSLARSESGGDFKTPTGGRLALGEKTPFHTPSAASLEDLMVLTAAGKRFSHSSTGKVTDSGHSDDMSVVGENSRSYDYGKLPPELDVLLAEGNKDVEAVSVICHDEFSNLTSSIENVNSCALEHNRHELLYPSDVRDAGISHVIDLQRASGDTNFADGTNIAGENDCISEATPGVKSPVCSIDIDDNRVCRTPSDEVIQHQIFHTNATLLNEAKGRGDAAGASEEFKSPPVSARLNVVYDQPTTGSISSLLAKRKRIFGEGDDLLNELRPTLVDRVLTDKTTKKRVWSTSSFAKSVSRLKRLEALPFLSASKAEGNYSSSMVSGKGFDGLVACLDAQLSNAGECDRRASIASKMDSDCSENTGATKHTSLKEKVSKHAELPGLHMLQSHDKSAKSRNSMVSSLTTPLGKILANDKSKHNHESGLEQDAISAPQSMRNNFSLSDIASGDLEDGSNTRMPAFYVSSPEVREDGMVSASPLYKGDLSIIMDHDDQSLSLNRGAKKKADDVASMAENASTLLSEKKAESKLSAITSKYKKDDQILRVSFNSCGSDGATSLKGNLFDEVQDHNSDIASSSQKHKLWNDQKHYEGKSEVSNSIEKDSTVKDWASVFTSFCGVADQLLSSVTHKFDLALIGVLNDSLVHLAKMRSYELLHSQVRSEIAFDSKSFLHNKRLADTKSLLHSIVYEKAKLQLIRCKRDKLLDQNQRLKFRFEESKKLMSSCHHLCLHGQKNIQVGSVLPEPCSIDVGNKALVAAEISSLKLELDGSDEEVRKLTKYFHPYIKATEELTIAKTVAHVEDFVKRRVSCQSMIAELQLCEVKRLKVMQGQPDILYDYGGFMCQRFVVKSSNLIISNTLNSDKISGERVKPDLKANAAFSYVITDESHLSYEGLSTITQVTQKTSSLLHTLLDVIEEVELAAVELINLTLYEFCQLSAGKLDLQLCFTHFSSGVRVTLSLDISCLKWGIYPSQVLPYEVQGRAARKDDSIDLLVADINAALRAVKCGYMRILSICRCVARVIEAHGMR